MKFRDFYAAAIGFNVAAVLFNASDRADRILWLILWTMLYFALYVVKVFGSELS